MSRHLTADEIRQEYIATMGKELGGQFNRLHNECAWLHLKWSEYVSLYGTSPSRIDLLNKSAGGFFGVVQTALWDDILLHLCRLTDDSEVGRRKRQTLSIRRLPTLVDPPIRETLELKRLVSEALRKTQFARVRRSSISPQSVTGANRQVPASGPTASGQRGSQSGRSSALLAR